MCAQPAVYQYELGDETAHVNLLILIYDQANQGDNCDFHRFEDGKPEAEKPEAEKPKAEKPRGQEDNMTRGQEDKRRRGEEDKRTRGQEDKRTY